MYKKIFKIIKKYDEIVIVRHVGGDPDAYGSQNALKDSIMLTFPKKKVYSVGASASKFNYFGKMDKYEGDPQNALLIILDTPDKRRVDGVNIDKFAYSIKIDHHILVDKMCDMELINDRVSSTCELILELINNTRLKANKSIMEKLFMGIVSDTNRFLFSNTSPKLFSLVSNMLNIYDIDITSLYDKLYLRSLNDVRFQGYIEQNLVVTDNGVGYIILNSDVIKKYKIDSSTGGNVVNNLNYIDEVLVWVIASFDDKNDLYKVNIRSRGPIIVKTAEEYGGGGHRLASGARINSKEEVQLLINDLNKVCLEYIKENIHED